MELNDEKILGLREIANNIRESIVEMLLSAGSGHTAGPLGMTDVFTILYFHILKHDPKNIEWEERDRVVLSNGHICPVLYATMAHAGYMPVSELNTLRKFGSRLQGHPHREFMPWLETSSGPLGEGLSQAVGMSIALRMNNKKNFTYCFLGDGELNEGQNWEAIMLAGKERFGKLVVFVDRNNIQIDGNTEDIMPLNSLTAKWTAFNWHVQEIDGHNFEMINDAVGKAHAVPEQPSVIICRTIPGKGVPEFEYDYHWHGKAPNKDEAKKALEELHTLGGKIKAEHH